MIADLAVIPVADLQNMIRTAVLEALDQRPLPTTIERQATARHFTRQEVLELLRISAPTLREMERRGKLVPLRIGRKVLFDSEAVTVAIERMQGRQ